MKKIVCVVLVLCMAVVVFVGCGNTATQASAPAETKAAAPAETKAAAPAETEATAPA